MTTCQGYDHTQDRKDPVPAWADKLVTELEEAAADEASCPPVYIAQASKRIRDARQALLSVLVRADNLVREALSHLTADQACGVNLLASDREWMARAKAHLESLNVEAPV